MHHEDLQAIDAKNLKEKADAFSSGKGYFFAALARDCAAFFFFISSAI